MSRNDYARIFIHAPTRLVLILIAAFGGGAGWLHFSDPGDDLRAARAETEACRVVLADIRGIAWQHEQDIADLIAWADRTLATLGPVQRLGAQNDAPPVYEFARGSISR